MKVIEQVYDLRHKFVLVGLTGRTGSGSSSVAHILAMEREDFVPQKLDKLDRNALNETYPNVNEQRKLRIVNEFIRENWNAFYVIKASNIIVYYALLLNNFEDFRFAIVDNLATIGKYTKNERPEVSKKLNKLKKMYETLATKALWCQSVLDNVRVANSSDVQECWNFLNKEISEFKGKLREELGCNYIHVFQKFGNNIRKCNIVTNQPEDDFAENAPSCLADQINKVVKLIRLLSKIEGKAAFIAIDSLRNPYEILYFRERYASFYIMSINTTNETRRENLKSKNYTEDYIKAIDEVEKEKKSVTTKFMEIDIDKCIELSDIHVSLEESLNLSPANPDGMHISPAESKLIAQLITYISLILHPGLVPPSSYERIMQIAYTAKLNSGCLSRQVGAVVTNKDFSVRSIGWNTVPQGQAPCSLRCFDDYYEASDTQSFSTYERSNEDFTRYVNHLHTKMNAGGADLKGLRLSYCFKDVYTSGANKQTYNQVHTRSLHAEENAFLQLAKYGSMGMEECYLFTTASCCELCAKKACQLGIKEIYYIDAYPGITASHILSCGVEAYRPKMKLFSGAVGRAYINLFNPLIPLKDEIESRTGIDVKDTIKNFRIKESPES